MFQMFIYNKSGGGDGGIKTKDKMAAILPELYIKYRANLQAVHTDDPYTHTCPSEHPSWDQSQEVDKKQTKN